MKLTMGVERFLVVDEPDFKLFHGDAFRIVPNIHQIFPLVFCDPPFFTWQSGGKGDEKPDHNLLSYEMYKKVQPLGSLWLCGTQPQLADDWHYWHRFFTLSFELIQAKSSGPPAINKKQLRRVHENIWCLYRSADGFSQLKLTVDRVTAKGTTKFVGPHESGKGPMRIWGSGKKPYWRVGVGYPISIFYCKKIDKNHPEYVGHPTQKPEELIELIIKMSTEEGDWILDPFCGSGTIPTVAKRLKRNCMAVEIEDGWIEVIKRRVKGEAAKTTVAQFIDERITDEEFRQAQQQIEQSKPRKKLEDWV